MFTVPRSEQAGDCGGQNFSRAVKVGGADEHANSTKESSRLRTTAKSVGTRGYITSDLSDAELKFRPPLRARIGCRRS